MFGLPPLSVEVLRLKDFTKYGLHVRGQDMCCFYNVIYRVYFFLRFAILPAVRDGSQICKKKVSFIKWSKIEQATIS